MNKLKKKCCNYCGREYVREILYTRHIILCELLHKSKKVKEYEKEDEEELPSLKRVYQMLKELSIKYDDQRKKIEILELELSKRKKKIDILKLLEKNYPIPEIGFKEWTKKTIVEHEYIEKLFKENENIFQIIKNIFEKNIKKENIKNYPIQCFSKNLFYIYDFDIDPNTGQQKLIWQKMKIEAFINFMKQIQSKIINEVLIWRTNNIEKINQNDQLAISYSKNLMKIMSIRFQIDSPDIIKMKSSFQNLIKTEIDTIEIES
jgi:hypothetical protein